ncbi:MAG: type III-B CRISPR module-associated Cmr3 family protein [Akkermansia sp.]
MNELILTPSDVLQMGDARPMAGSLTGHTLLWPTPDLVAHALHAALHRSRLEGHRHHYHPQSRPRTMDGPRSAAFGSVLHAGPFPVRGEGADAVWYFPCPLDIEQDSLVPTVLPSRARWASSLPAPLQYGAISLLKPSKENPAPAWLSAADLARYGAASAGAEASARPTAGARPADMAELELRYGIALDDSSRSVEQHRFYSAQSLRLKPGWHLGSWVSSSEKTAGGGREDILEKLFAAEHRIVIGGQQRICTATLRPAPALHRLPAAPATPPDADGKLRLKWVLLTPAIWSCHGSHPGGWLPHWVDAATGQVMLGGGDRTRRPGEARDVWRQRLRAEYRPIRARLVAAIVGKPVTITGYARAGRCDGAEGPKSTHAAAPAGSVYYFECDSTEDGAALIHALHANAQPGCLIRRSELLGEQGFGLGLCFPWHFAS